MQNSLSQANINALVSSAIKNIETCRDLQNLLMSLNITIKTEKTVKPITFDRMSKWIRNNNIYKFKQCGHSFDDISINDNELFVTAINLGRDVIAGTIIENPSFQDPFKSSDIDLQNIFNKIRAEKAQNVIGPFTTIYQMMKDSLDLPSKYKEEFDQISKGSDNQSVRGVSIVLEEYLKYKGTFRNDELENRVFQSLFLIDEKESDTCFKKTLSGLWLKNKLMDANKQLGEGQQGAVHKFCLPFSKEQKDCDGEQNLPLAVKFLSPNGNESEMMGICFMSLLYERNHCIHIPFFYKKYKCIDCPLEKQSQQIANKVCDVLISPFIDGITLDDFLSDMRKRKAPVNKAVIKSLFVQIFMTCFLFQNYDFIHNDIHGGNIMIKQVQAGGYFEYQYEGKSYFVENIGWIAIIIDFGYCAKVTMDADGTKRYVGDIRQFYAQIENVQKNYFQNAVKLTFQNRDFVVFISLFQYTYEELKQTCRQMLKEFNDKTPCSAMFHKFIVPSFTLKKPPNKGPSIVTSLDRKFKNPTECLTEAKSMILTPRVMDRLSIYPEVSTFVMKKGELQHPKEYLMPPNATIMVKKEIIKPENSFMTRTDVWAYFNGKIKTLRHIKKNEYLADIV